MRSGHVFEETTKTNILVEGPSPDSGNGSEVNAKGAPLIFLFPK